MTTVGRNLIKTIHIIGDSHTLGFKGRSAVLSDFDLVVTTDVQFVRGFDVQQLVQNNQLHPAVVNYFLQQNIVTKEGVKAAASRDLGVIAEQYSGGTGFQRQIVMFFGGEIFVRRYLGAAHANPNFKMSEAHEKFRQVAEQYVFGVKAIQANFGIFPVVHELSPPTGDDDSFERVNNFRCPRELRAVIYQMFNTQLADAAAKYKVAFCRSADYLNKNGCLAPEYEFDGVHADPKFVYTSLQRVVMHWLYGRSAERSDRYIAWCDQSGLVAQRAPISIKGVSGVSYPFTADQLQALRNALTPFEPAVCKKPSLDWGTMAPGTDNPKFNESIRYASLRPEGLKILHDVLIAGPTGDALRAMLGAKFSIVNVRPVQSSPHDGPGFSQQELHLDACPAGVYRGLIYLTDVDDENGPFEYLPSKEATTPVQVKGNDGAAFFFDANAVLHRATPPRRRPRMALDLIMLVQPESCTEIVFSHAGYTWPVDPYLFELDANCYPRLKGDRWFYPDLIVPKDPSRGVKTLSAAEMAPARRAG